jgi:WD40 repeat protein
MLKAIYYSRGKSFRWALWAFLFLAKGGFAEEMPSGIVAQFRADHMVLESVIKGNLIFAATQNGRINCFNLKTGTREKDLLRLEPGVNSNFPPAVFSVALSPRGNFLAAGTSIGKVFVFDPISFSLLKTIIITGIENILVVRFLNENQLLLGLMDGTVRLVDWNSNRELYRVKVELDPVNNIRLSPNRKSMAVTTGASTIKILRAADGKIVQELDGHKDTIYGLVFSGTRRLFSGSKDMTLRLWNLATGNSKVLYKSSFFINSVAWNGKNLVAFHLPNYEIGIMNYLTGSMLKRLKGHSAFINTLFFISPDRLLSSGNDARIFIHKI